jgi:DNA-binding transcriptional regulator YiaG
VPTTATFDRVATVSQTGTIALADQLIHLRERVPLAEADIAEVTGADAETVAAWLDRQVAPAGQHAVRLSELIAACERLAVSTKPEFIPEWLRRQVPSLGGQTPLHTLASGGYEQIAGLAEDLIYPTFT